jgi:formylglycine-generating enzyme required for sulfatase activity
VRPGKDWLTRDPTVPQPYRKAPPAPRTTHPVQYVSPEAALLVARQLGCRLPTSEEWRAAFRPGGGNLRDAAWQDHQRYIAEVRARKPRARVQWPDSGAFLPPGAKVARRADAQPATVENDGVLWFAPVGAGSGLQHMTGNVAEYVLDAAEAFENRFPDPSAATPGALRAFVDEVKDQLKVVGGSALSPPELWDGKDRPFHTPLPTSLSGARYGYSDVGFRLAFSSPSTPLVVKLQQILDKHAYLP